MTELKEIVRSKKEKECKGMLWPHPKDWPWWCYLIRLEDEDLL